MYMGEKPISSDFISLVSKLHTSCFYHNYFKNYKLLNMITPNKMVNMVRTILLAN